MTLPRWLMLAIQFDGDEFVPMPPNAILLSDNGISRTYYAEKEGLIFKQSIPFLINNEIYFLQKLGPTGYVPDAERYDKYTIMMDFIETEPITNTTAFMRHRPRFLAALQNAGIRHGDLTTANVLVVDNKPIIIDWAESRRWGDMRPDKRIEGDSHWSQVTWDKLCQ